MKSVVNNVIGMAVGVACLALVVNRPSEADEKNVTEGGKQIVVVKTDGEADVADALKKALHEKLEGLPEDIQKKIRQKLEAVREVKQVKKIEKPETDLLSARQLELKAGEAGQQIILRLQKEGDEDAPKVEGMVEAKVIIVGPDGESRTIELDGGKLELLQAAGAQAGAELKHALRIVAEKKAEAEAKGQEASEKIAQVKKRIAAKVKKLAVESGAAEEAAKTVTIKTQACPDGECKTVCIAIAVDDDEVSAKTGAQTMTVTVDGDKVLLNGKAIKIPALENLKKGAFKVEVKKDADDAEKVTQRKMIFMGEDGKVQEFNVDVNVESDHVIVGKPHVTKEGKAGVTAHAYVVVSDDDKDGKEAKKQIRWRAVQADPDKKAATYQVIKVAPGDHHVMPLHVSGIANQNAEVAKRLQGIETELKKIRKLLEQMKDSDDEKEDDD